MDPPERLSFSLLVPDYEEYYSQETHSDVSIVITDEEASSEEAAVERRLPGHIMVLVAFSKYCKAKAKPTIANDLTQQQLLQVLLLADRFEVPKVLAAVAAPLLHAMQSPDVDWDIVLQLLQLPSSCACQEPFSAMQQLAMQRLQQQLGDLEEVWASDTLQQQLVQLPHAALLQLLQHKGTRTVMPQSSLVQQCFKLSELALLQTCCMPGGYAALNAVKAPVLLAYPAWKAEQRPASAKQPVIDWFLPLSTLEGAAMEVLSGKQTIAGCCSRGHILQGQPMMLGLVIGVVDTGAVSPGEADSRCKRLQLGVGLVLQDLLPNAVRVISAKLTLLNVSGTEAEGVSCASKPWSADTDDWGVSMLVDMGQVSSWGAMQAELQQEQLVHLHDAGRGDATGPYLHIRCEVTELL
ncbi:hypothetical protein COO60DRAFT_1458818 [Scenedesmus sp. NREL 46B-D3]|nr:hypothetical protein COO60DRAFT_1458818 [Scenedesmus sp. NREL 46B-D3]